MVIERLRPGTLQGRVTKSLGVADFILTEAAFAPHSRLPRHARNDGRLDDKHSVKVGGVSKRELLVG